MRSVLETRRVMVYRSDVRPELQTEDEAASQIIAWADEHPTAYDVVTSGRSHAFGLGSRDYVGWAQTAKTPEGILERLRMLHRYATGQHAVNMPEKVGLDFLCWRARFVLEHFESKAYSGGLFQQHAVWTDGAEYPRHCMTLDYTPKTLEEVIDRFVAWINLSSAMYKNTTRITLDGKDVRRFDKRVHVVRRVEKERGRAAKQANRVEKE